MPARFVLSSRAVAALVAAVTFGVYVATLYPDLPGGDSGELIGALATGGVIHPPGYPLYALLGRVFLHLPHGTIAWRLNLFSATCDALAAAALFLAVARWTGSRWGGVVAAGLFAFAPGIWLYAISAEVFALNNLFVAVLFLLATLYAERQNRTYAYAGALASGLALANHHTIIFVVFPFALWMLWTGRHDLLAARPLASLGALLLVGLAPYALLVVGPRTGAFVSWGATDTWSGFWTHVLRRDYGALRLQSGGDVPGRAPRASFSGTFSAWAEDLAGELGWWGMPLFLGGLVLSLRAALPRRTPVDSAAKLALPLAGGIVISVTVFSLLWGLPASDPLRREILARFWQQPAVLCFAFCGAGVAALERLVAARAASARRFAMPVLSGALAFASFGFRLGALDHHASRVVRDYGAEILRAAPPGSLLLTKGDLITNTTRYLRLSEGVRPDVAIVDQELLGYAWYAAEVRALYPDVRIPGTRYMPGAGDGFFMKQLLDANFDRGPILICGGVKEGDLTADATYGRWPFGLCEIVHRGDEAVNVDDWIRASDGALPRIAFGGEESRATPGSWEGIAWGDYWQVRENRGLQLITIAGADPSRRRYLAAAEPIFAELIDTNPAPPARLYKDLALAIGRQGLETPADRARAAAAWRGYLKVAPADDPQRAGIERELARLSAR